MVVTSPGIIIVISDIFCNMKSIFFCYCSCVALNENLSEQKTHTSISGEEHLLCEVNSLLP